MSDKPVTTKGPFADGMMYAANLLNPTDQELHLACGEMTAQENRTARAVLGWAKATIRQSAEDDNGYGF